MLMWSFWPPVSCRQGRDAGDGSLPRIGASSAGVLFEWCVLSYSRVVAAFVWDALARKSLLKACLEAWNLQSCRAGEAAVSFQYKTGGNPARIFNAVHTCCLSGNGRALSLRAWAFSLRQRFRKKQGGSILGFAWQHHLH